MTFGNYNNGGFLSNLPTVTRNLLTINAIMFVATLINQDFMIRTFAMFYPHSPFFRIWQPVTHMFMHGSFWHIFFNMYSLFLFGTVIERYLGSKKFLVFYFVCGLGAALLHTGVEFLQGQAAIQAADFGAIQRIRLTPTLGASGAVYGLLLGYAMLFPESVLTLVFPPVSLRAKWFVVIFGAIELLTGVLGTNDGVAHFAHLGGMLFGWALMFWWKKTGRMYQRDNWI